MRKVVGHDENVVQPGVVVRQRWAVAIGEKAFKFADADLGFRIAAPIAPPLPLSVAPCDLAMPHALLRRLIGERFLEGWQLACLRNGATLTIDLTVH
jgi:hypothetical protein